MAQEYLALLNSAAQTTSDVFGRIEKSLQNANQFQLQTNAQELNVRGQALQLVENQRMHDATIQQMNNNAALAAKEFAFRSELQAKEYQLQAEIQPLKVQNERLAIEARATQAKLGNLEIGLKMFEGMSAPVNELATNEWLKNGQDSAWMEELLATKAKWLAKTANGEKWDVGAYQAELDGIKSKYITNTPKPAPAWDDRKQGLVSQFSPKMGEIYKHGDPTVAGTRSGLSTSMLDLDLNDPAAQKSNTESRDKLQRLTTPEEYAAFDHNATVYRNNKMNIISAQRERQNILSSGTVKGDKKDAMLAEQDAKIKSWSEQNAKIRDAFAKQNFSMKQEEIPAVPPLAVLPPDGQGSKQLRQDALGYKQPIDPLDEEGQKAYTGIHDVAKNFIKDPQNRLEKEASILKGLDRFEWFDENFRGKGAPSQRFAQVTKDTIKNNINELTKNDDSEVDRIFNSDVVNKLVKQVGNKNVMVPLGPSAIRIARKYGINLPGIKANARSSGGAGVGAYGQSDGGGLDYFASFGGEGGWFDAGNGAKSIQDLGNLTGKISNKEDRLEFKKEMLSALTAAAFSSSMTK